MIKKKRYKRIKSAERYQMRLLSEYGIVNLIAFPMFSESGIYVFEINQPLKKKSNGKHSNNNE